MRFDSHSDMLRFSLAFQLRLFAGGHRGVVTPVPIPNTEVKGSFAEGSAGLARARVGRRRLFYFHSRGIRLRMPFRFSDQPASPMIGCVHAIGKLGSRLSESALALSKRRNRRCGTPLRWRNAGLLTEEFPERLGGGKAAEIGDGRHVHLGVCKKTFRLFESYGLNFV